MWKILETQICDFLYYRKKFRTDDEAKKMAPTWVHNQSEEFSFRGIQSLVKRCRIGDGDVEKDFTQSEDRSVNLNRLVDRFIPQIAKFIVNRGLDPLYLPCTERKLWQFLNSTSEISIQPTIYKTDFVLHSGKLECLSNLKRYGNATLAYKKNILNIEFGFEFELLKATIYDYILKLVIDWTGRFTVSGENVHVKVNISFNTTDYILVLNRFELQIDGSIKVIFDQNELISVIKTVLIKMVIPFFKNTITNTVQQEVTNAIRLYFNEINRKIVPPKKSQSIFQLSVTKS